ncbi:MAG: tetratricopeptide repeat protein [Chitinophagales bacterium]
MKKQQYLLAIAGMLILTGLYFFGNTVSKSKPVNSPQRENSSQEKQLDISEILQASESKLRPEQVGYVNRLKNAVVRGDVKNQQIKAFRQLADFWKDSVQDAFLPSAYYEAELAKLENSEKSLTFAAQLFLDNLRGQQPVFRNWMAAQAKELFERALALNPQNDSARIGLGATNIFGGGNVMQGVQQILEVSMRDSTNMYAQFMLALGGLESGQFDKAIERLNKVVLHEPHNLEAILILAEAYEQKGDKSSAIRWYTAAKSGVNNQELIREIDKRLKSLQ